MSKETMEPITRVLFGEIADWHRHPNGGGLVYRTATVDPDAYVGPNAQVFGSAQVYGSARVSGDARVYGNAWVFGAAQVFGSAQVYGSARVSGDAQVFGSAQVYGSARVSGDARVYGNAVLARTTDYLRIGPIGSRDGTTTFTVGGLVFCGCWSGTIEEFEWSVRKEHGDNEHAKAYLAAIEFVRACKGDAWLNAKGGA